ncbi:hypothetical protein GCM10027061_18130 [Nesterenkonia suensis]
MRRRGTRRKGPPAAAGVSSESGVLVLVLLVLVLVRGLSVPRLSAGALGQGFIGWVLAVSRSLGQGQAGSAPGSVTGAYMVSTSHRVNPSLR